VLSAQQALECLREGNRRFVSGEQNADTHLRHSKQSDLAQDQEPFAIILGCSDSRVPTEIIFDQGPGDLFVIRIAGNIVAPSQIGSIEFAAAQFGTRLVVVMGHSHCGAVRATIDEIRPPAQGRSHHMGSIIDRIRPTVEKLAGSRSEQDSEAFLDSAIRANVSASVEQLKTGSEILEQLIRDDGLLVVGAEYSLENRVVDFFDCD
jgi:carbonic anhydrase